MNKHGEMSYDAPFPLRWYLEVYPHLSKEQKPLECMLNPGEIIFVPSGWWHQVLNFGDTIAVTQNYLNSQNFEHGRKDMLSSDKDSLLLLKMLHDRLGVSHPQLWEGLDLSVIDVTESDSDDSDTASRSSRSSRSESDSDSKTSEE